MAGTEGASQHPLLGQNYLLVLAQCHVDRHPCFSIRALGLALTLAWAGAGAGAGPHQAALAPAELGARAVLGGGRAGRRVVLFSRCRSKEPDGEARAPCPGEAPLHS